MRPAPSSSTFAAGAGAAGDAAFVPILGLIGLVLSVLLCLLDAGIATACLADGENHLHPLSSLSALECPETPYNALKCPRLRRTIR